MSIVGDNSSEGHVAVVAAADAHGAVAIASIDVAATTTELPGTGLEAPLIAHPIMRGVARQPAGSPLPCTAPIGISQARASSGFGPIDLAIGVGGPTSVVHQVFAELARALSSPTALHDDVIASPRKRRASVDAGSVDVMETGCDPAFGIACGVAVIGRGRARVLTDPRR
ncbi:MAG: hypothetical protein NVS3B20_07540 [Polyangiales bacterium]